LQPGIFEQPVNETLICQALKSGGCRAKRGCRKPFHLERSGVMGEQKVTRRQKDVSRLIREKKQLQRDKIRNPKKK
jgi:hypothetical protein